MKLANKKRIASAVLAGTMALSMTATGFAADNETTISGEYKPITLAVTVPTTGKAIINPYGLPYSLGESTISGEQITTGSALTILNKSAVGLKVGAKITTTASSGVTLESQSAASGYDAETDKKLAVVFQAFPADTLVGDTATDTAFVNSAFAALKSEDAVLTGELSTTAPVTAAKVNGKDDLILREGNADGELQKGGAAFFRLSGKAAQGATWTAQDTFTATVAFTFTPASYTKSAGTLTTTSQSLAVDGTTDVTLALKLPDKITAKKVSWVSAKPNQVEVADASTGLGTAGAVVKGTVKGIASTSSPVKITVNVTGSDGITYTATTSTDNSVEVS